MKLIQWSEGYDSKGVGGGPSHLNNLVSNTQEYKTLIIGNRLPGQIAIEEIDENTNFLRFPIKANFVTNPKYLQSKKSLYPFKLIHELQTINSKFNYLNTINFDILHVHGIKFYPTLRNINTWTKLEVYQHMLDFSKIKVPKILTVHNFLPGFTNNSEIVNLYNYYLDQFDNIICVDRQIFDYCRDYCNGNGYHKKIWYIPNSIDTQIFSYKAPDLGKNLKLGFVGRLAETVDLDIINFLIENLPNDVDFYLAVSGDISLIKIPNHKKEQIKILQDVPNNGMPDFYHSVDVVFNPVIHSGLTRVNIESMSCGRPVLIYNNQDRDPAFFNDTNTFFTNKNDVLEKVKEIQKDMHRVHQFGIKSRKTIETNFSNSIIIPRVKDIYKEIISSYERN